MRRHAQKQAVKHVMKEILVDSVSFRWRRDTGMMHMPPDHPEVKIGYINEIPSHQHQVTA
jgi:hypothetical protein